MGNEESIGQNEEFGQFGANPNMMSSNFNQRTNPGINAGPLSNSFMSGNRPTPKTMGSFGNRPPGPTAAPIAAPGLGPPLPDVDLSGLTEEEKLMIQQVMARAEQETGGEVGISPVRAPVKQPAMNSHSENVSRQDMGPHVRPDIRQEMRQSPRQDVRQNTGQDMRDAFREDNRQEVRQNMRQNNQRYPNQEFNENESQLGAEQRGADPLNQKILQQQEFRQEIRQQYQTPEPQTRNSPQHQPQQQQQQQQQQSQYHQQRPQTQKPPQPQQTQPYQQDTLPQQHQNLQQSQYQEQPFQQQIQPKRQQPFQQQPILQQPILQQSPTHQQMSQQQGPHIPEQSLQGRVQQPQQQQQGPQFPEPVHTRALPQQQQRFPQQPVPQQHQQPQQSHYQDEFIQQQSPPQQQISQQQGPHIPEQTLQGRAQLQQQQQPQPIQPQQPLHPQQPLQPQFPQQDPGFIPGLSAPKRQQPFQQPIQQQSPPQQPQHQSQQQINQFQEQPAHARALPQPQPHQQQQQAHHQDPFLQQQQPYQQTTHFQQKPLQPQVAPQQQQQLNQQQQQAQQLDQQQAQAQAQQRQQEQQAMHQEQMHREQNFPQHPQTYQQQLLQQQNQSQPSPRQERLLQQLRQQQLHYQQQPLHPQTQPQPQPQHPFYEQNMRQESAGSPHHLPHGIQQQTKQQNYSQEEYQSYQNANQMRNQLIQSQDGYQSYPSTSMLSMTTSTATTTGARPHDMGSASHKTIIGSAPIPRTVPLHLVTQQLATSSSSSSSSSSGSSSSSSSPKQKPIQSLHQTHSHQIQPKKTPPQVPECWSPPTDLSPILDVSPSLEAAEQLIMENITSNGESLPSIVTNIPRATSGTISGMIADFNKAIEALGTTSPTEEQYQISSKLKQLERDPRHQKQPLQRQMSDDSVQRQRQLKDSDVKSNLKSETSVQKTSIDSTSGPQPIIVMTSGPNQSTIPLQLQLNPQAVNQSLLPSPQVEQQLQQQQILIQQQQQFLQIQIEQQRLQKQMTEQLNIRQQQEIIDKQKKEPKEPIIQQGLQHGSVQGPQPAPPKPEIVKQDKQVSTSTPPSATSTPTSVPKAVTTSSSVISKTSEPSVSVSGVGSRKSLHRRLPHATTEEMQTAVQTLAAAHHNVQRTAPSVISTQMMSSSQRPISPLMPRKTQQSVISSQTILNPSTRRTNLSTATVLTTATSTLVSSAVMPSTSIYDRISPSPYAFGQSVLRSHTPITPGGDFSDSQSDVSGDKGKRRRLPSVPLDEEPISPVIATRKLIKERLAGRPALSSTSIATKRIPPLRPSSSLDSAVTGLVSSYRRPNSPFSSSSDITQFLASTYGQSVLKSPIGNIRSPARSPIPPGESQIGQLTKTLERLTSSSPSSPTRHPSYMRNIKQQLWDELKIATEEKYRLMSLRDRDKDYYRRSETDLQTLYDAYSSPVRRRRGRYKSKNASDSRIYRSYSSPREDIPFKSYEFESLHPNRSLNDMSYRNRRPMSSMAAYSDTEALHDSMISDMFDANDNNLYLSTNPLNRSARRRSEGSVEMMSRFGYGLDPYGRSSSNYYYDDLTQQRRRVGAGHRATRSWNPSPYVSEDEDDHLTREEKAAKVRAEIKRRRQQMADTGRLYRHSIDGSGLQYGPMDDIYGQSALIDEDYYNYNPIVHQMPKDYYNGRLRTNYSQPSLHPIHGHDNYGYTNYDPRQRPVPQVTRRGGPNPRDEALLRRPNYAHPDMGSLMSATESDTPSDVFMDPMLNTPAMPILPDMPTRSRKLLEDLGSSPIASGGHRSGYGQNMMRGSPKKTQVRAYAPVHSDYRKY